MQNRIDWRLALDLVMPGATYGWLATDKDDIYGQYEWIDWRDSAKMPTKKELEQAWNDYVLANGTPEEQEQNKKQKKELALQRLKASSDQTVLDLLELVS